MAMTKKEKAAVQKTIAESLRRKFADYKHDGTVMPFHTRLLGKDRMALFSFIQSLNTTFGTVIYEPVAETLASANFSHVVRGHRSGGVISSEAQKVILEIKNDLERVAAEPDRKKEVRRIRAVCQKGAAVKINLRQADVYLVDKKKNLHYPIDIKTAKPNVDGFEKYKENILKWTAAILYENPKADVGAMVGIPYNPFYPAPYKHWTIRGMFDIGEQIKVAEEFWDFLAGKPVYEDLLDCFEAVGVEMRGEIDAYFKRFGKA